MEMAYLTIVVADACVRDVVDHLRDLRGTKLEVLADGDITLSNTDLETVPNEVWLFDRDGKGALSLVKDGETSDHGRVLTDGELRALQDYGVCVELRAGYPSAAKYGTPAYVRHIEAAMAVATSYGFGVAEQPHFKTSFGDNGDDSPEERWLRVRVPAWMNFNATL